MKAKMNKTYITAVINTSISILNSHYEFTLDRHPASFTRAQVGIL